MLYISFLFMPLFVAYGQDSFSGIYYMENQAEYDTDRKWIEITRNKYQEIIINSPYYNDVVAYYDEENHDLFYIQEKHAQYNSLMKIKIISGDKIELYMLDENKWKKNKDRFVKTKKPSGPLY